jgi:23S rRNA pseudouridine1911/1915/1917 synthase
MRHQHPVEIKILYEDDYLIAINKPSGLLSVATDQERDATAFRLVRDHIAYGNRKARLYILHRLDRDTSGILLFAKDRNIQEVMQSKWNEMVTERGYMAIVEGHPHKTEDELRSYITENRAMVVYQSKGEEDGKLAITRYRVTRFNDSYSLLKINILTGRKNQIRVQLSGIGHPIAGDKKYGAKSNPINRLALHADRLSFTHPISGKTMRLRTPLPGRFHIF